MEDNYSGYGLSFTATLPPYVSNSPTLRESLFKILYEETPPPDPGPEDLYDDRGFTIYRTDYGPSTDTYWFALIQTVRANLRADISQYYVDKEYPVSEDEKEGGKLLLDLFRLDKRSGLKLRRKCLNDLRDSYHKESYGWSKICYPYGPEDQLTPNIFFITNSEVFEAINAGTYVFKCVDMDFMSGIKSHIQEYPRVIGFGCQ